MAALQLELFTDVKELFDYVCTVSALNQNTGTYLTLLRIQRYYTVLYCYTVDGFLSFFYRSELIVINIVKFILYIIL